MKFFEVFHIAVSSMALALAIAALTTIYSISTDDIVPMTQRIAALETAPKDTVIEEVDACNKRAIEQTGVDTGYYKLCMDLVLTNIEAKKELARLKRTTYPTPAAGE